MLKAVWNWLKGSPKPTEAELVLRVLAPLDEHHDPKNCEKPACGFCSLARQVLAQKQTEAFRPS